MSEYTTCSNCGIYYNIKCGPCPQCTAYEERATMRFEENNTVRTIKTCDRCIGRDCTCERYGTKLEPLTDVQQEIKYIGTDVVNLLLKKNKDYGSSVFESPILFPELKAKDCILIRMSDKIKRFSNLVSNDKTPEVDETIADTMKDLAGYAILWLVANEMESTNAVHRD